MKPLLWFTGILLLTSCVTTEIPAKEYTIAKSAYDAAVAAEALKYAPQLFYKAEKAYKKAESLYKERYYEEARKEFLLSQKYSEKAETASRLKQNNLGDESEN